MLYLLVLTLNMEEDVIEEPQSDFAASDSKAVEDAYNMRKFLDTNDLSKSIGSAIEMLSVLRNTRMKIAEYQSISKLNN
jgi:hypothetical protein